MQTTDFPREQATPLKLAAAPDGGAVFTLRVRHPAWVDGPLKISVNGNAVAAETQPDDYADIARIWQAGDAVRVELPMTLAVEPLPGSEAYVELRYGPVVLSGALGRTNLAKSDFWQIRTTVPTIAVSDDRVPVVVTDDARELLRSVTPVGGKPLTFRLPARPGTVTHVPFYENHFQRYALYFRKFTPAQWTARETDRVVIADETSENAHDLQALRSETGRGTYDGLETSWRDARDGGFIQYVLKLPAIEAAAADDAPAAQVLALRLSFWGRDAGRRTFDVVANGRVLDTVILSDTGRDAFRHVELSLPAGPPGDARFVTIRLQARPGHSAGGLFDLRLLRALDARKS